MKRLESGALQGEAEFRQEIMVLSRFRHRNVLPFLGCSVDEGQRCIVYELMENGSLEQCLSERPASLPWYHRIIITVA